MIVLGRRGVDVLLVPNGERHMLPRVEISRWQRVAENVTATVKTDWAEEVVCLFQLPTESADDRGIIRYQAAEHLCQGNGPNKPIHWVAVSTVRQDSLTEASDYVAIKQVGEMCNRGTEGASARPFACLGWFGELRDWIQSVIEPMGFHLTGEFRQLNASPTFSLVRFETDGPALWFKAVGEPNLREFGITCALSRLLPNHIPPVLATRPDWNGWLSREVGGKLLSDVPDPALWGRAAEALARLQIESIDRGSQILSAGAHDLGSAALSKLILPFMGVMAQLMERQPKVPPAVLDRKDLLLLQGSLESGIHAIEDIGIPETLGHLDLNPGNIVISDSRCAFLDWAEAYVGNPMFSLEYLVRHAGRALGAESSVGTSLAQAYCAQWGSVISPAAITDALAFAPLLAVYAYGVGNNVWRQPQELQEPTAGYLRSLARRMHREAKRITDRRTLCLL